MNKSYKIIFNKNTGKKEVVSELAKNKNGLVKSVSAVGLLSSLLLVTAFGQTYYDYSGVNFNVLNSDGAIIPPNTTQKNYTIQLDGAGGFALFEGGRFTAQNGAVFSVPEGALALVNNQFAVNNSSLKTQYFFISASTINSINVDGKSSNVVVSNKGKVEAEELYLGGGGSGTPTTSGHLTIDGVGSSVVIDGEMTVGLRTTTNSAPSTVIVRNGGSLTAGELNLGYGSGGNGVLYIGAKPGETVVDPGQISVDTKITLGEFEQSKIVFNHSSDNYKFDPIIDDYSTRSSSFADVELIAGRTIFTSDQTYSGLTVVDNSAILQLGDGGTRGSVKNSIRLGSQNAQAVFDRSNTHTHTGIISGTGTVTKRNNNTLIFTANQTYTGKTTVAGGILQLGNGGTSGSLSGDVVVNQGGTLAVSRSDNYTFARDVSGQGGFSQTGSGTTTLTGNHSYTGVTNVTKGTLALGKNNAISTSSSSVNVANGATLTLAGKQQSLNSLTNGGTVNFANGQLTLNANSSSTSAQGLTGDGTLTVKGGDFSVSATNNTLSANVVINDGASASLSQSGNLGTGNINLSGALNLLGTNTVANQISGAGVIDTKASSVSSLTGNNVGFTGTHNIAGTLSVTQQQNLGKGLVDLVSKTSSLILNGVTDAISNTIQGQGKVDVTADANTSLTADNSAFKGVYNVSGTLSVGEQKNLGGGSVDLKTQQSKLVLNGVKNSISSTLQGNGNVNITNNANTKLAANNSGFTGKISVDSGSKLTVDAKNQLGTSQVTNSGNVIFDNYAQGAKSTLTNSFSGKGAIDITKSSLELTSTKNFSGVTGNINVNASSNLYVSANNQINAGSTINLNESANLNINSTSALTWDRKAAGKGSINIDTAGKAINFGSNFGNTFAGTVNLKNSVFEIKGNDAKALTNATLVVSSGNTTNISGNDQSIGNLTMNGGTLEFGVASQNNSYNDLFARLNVTDLKTG